MRTRTNSYVLTDSDAVSTTGRARILVGNSFEGVKYLPLRDRPMPGDALLAELRAKNPSRRQREAR